MQDGIEADLGELSDLGSRWTQTQNRQMPVCRRAAQKLQEGACVGIQADDAAGKTSRLKRLSHIAIQALRFDRKKFKGGAQCRLAGCGHADKRYGDGRLRMR